MKCVYCGKETNQTIMGSTWGDEIPMCNTCLSKIKEGKNGDRN